MKTLKSTTEKAARRGEQAERAVRFQDLPRTQPALQFGALKRRWFFISFLVVVLVAVLAVHIDWTWKRKLSPRGGRYFFHRVELAVPSFRQADEKWSDDPLGGIEANGTLGGEGEAYFVAGKATSFWNRGSLRSGSNIGSSRSNAAVI